AGPEFGEEDRGGAWWQGRSRESRGGRSDSSNAAAPKGNKDGRLMASRILMVEDEPGLVMTVSDRLRAEGHEVDEVGDGATGLDRALSGAYDLVILDVMLPRKNGFDVCRGI